MKTTSIKITPKLIELDDRIVRVPNIASVTIGPDPVRRRWAIIIALISLATLYGAKQLYDIASMYGSFGRKGAVDFWIPILALAGLAGLALAVYLFMYQALFISTSDGRFTVLVDRKASFMREVMAKIREALLAGEASQIVYQVNVQAERIERLDANSTIVSNSAGAVVAGGSMTNGAGPSPGHYGMPSPAPSPNGNGAYHANGGGPEGVGGGSLSDMINRAREHVAPLAQQAAQVAGDVARRGRAMAEERMAAMRERGLDGQQPPQVNANTVTVNGAAPGAMIAGGAMSISDSRITTQGSVVNDFDSVMNVLQRENAAHKDQIIEYLRPVRDHLAGGGTSRDEAKTRWGWFAAQAAAALSGIDGVLTLIERVTRALGAGR